MNLLRGCARFVALCLLLLAPSAARAQDSGPDPATLHTIESQVRQLRGLDALSDIDLRVIDQAGLQQYLAQSFERDYLPNERESDQKELVALGLLKPTDDIVQIQLDLYQGQVIGIYDPDDKLMYVVSGGPFGASARVTYAHEYTHALQDMHFDLNKVAPKHPVSNDASLAAHAIVEGDAVLLQSLWGAANLSAEEIQELSRTGSSGDDSLARAPLVVRTELLFPYIEGAAFVRQAYRDAGNNPSAIDNLLTNLPDSTSQILHPARYRDGIHAVQVDLPELVDRLGADQWRKVGSGVLGELDTRVLLEQYGDRLEAGRVAAGWRGDHWQLLEKDGRSTIVLLNTWDSEASAGAFFSAYKRGQRNRFPSAATDEDSATRQALSTPTTATDVRLLGQAVQVVIGFDRADDDALIAALASPAAPVP